jgi:signal transduction histidine kinase
MPQTKPAQHQSEKPSMAGPDERFISKAMQGLLEVVANYKSRDLLSKLSEEVCEIFEVHSCMITLRENQNPITAFRILGSCVNGDKSDENSTYKIDFSPCEEVVLGNRAKLFTDGILDKFPDDPFFNRYQIRSYWGVPYYDLSDQLLGHLFIMDTKPIHHTVSKANVLQIFAKVCGAEVEKEMQREELEKARNIAEEVSAKLQDINQNLETIIEKRTAEMIEISTELDTFFYRASHDLKGPFATLEGLVNLEEKTYPDRLNSEYFQKLKETLTHLKELNSVIIEVGKVRYVEPDYTVFNLHEKLGEFAKEFREQYDPDEWQDVMITGDDGEIETDEQLFRLALEEIIDNAVRFRNARNPDMVSIITHIKHGLVWLEIKDKGIGIKPHHLDKVKEMFFKGTERGKGFGLGLYLAEICLKKVHGIIELESEERVGTKVILQLPERLSVAMAQESALYSIR